MGRKSLTVDAPHDLLDGLVHQDTAVDAVTRGSIIIGNSTPAWDELVIGTVNEILGTDGTDPLWRSLSEAGIQAQDAVLDDLAALAVVANNEFIVGTGAGTYAHESGATARTSMGVGTADSPQFTGIELGNATDTTLSRSAAGVLAVEGTDLLQADGSIALAGAWDMGSQVLTNVNIDSGVITGITDLTVADGGTGVSSLTDGGILLGSGTSAVTALGQATNGQLPIGSTGADPVLATLTGTANEIEITNGAGTITVGLPDAVTIGTDLTVTDQLFVSGVGPHAVGGSTVANVSNLFTGTFAGAGQPIGLSIRHTLQPAANNDSFLIEVAGTFEEASTGTHGTFAGTRYFRPTITAGAASLTNAATMKIDNAPTGATNNFSLWVDAGKTQLDGELEVDGDFNHDGSNIGFFGTAPAAQAAAYNQTFSTADRTHSGRTSGGLTDNSGGTVSQTLADITEANNAGSADRVPTEDAIASLANELADVRTDLADTAQVLNALVDDLQTYGLVQ